MFRLAKRGPQNQSTDMIPRDNGSHGKGLEGSLIGQGFGIQGAWKLSKENLFGYSLRINRPSSR